jgi:hypothetical protein
MIDKALLKLRPNAQWDLNGDEYEGIVWKDTEQTIPTKEEVEAKILELKAEIDANEYKEKRQAEYPSFIEYLDGIVKGDQAQIDKYIADCQAVKAKYPKPE